MMSRSNGDWPRRTLTGPGPTTRLASSRAVRAKAVWSLAYIGPPAEIDPAPIKEAVESDPAIEVRSAAMGALFTGWPEYSYNEDVLGR